LIKIILLFYLRIAGKWKGGVFGIDKMLDDTIKEILEDKK
jgi:hypothetical protein